MTSPQLEYLLPKRQTITDLNLDAENREPLYIIVEKIDWCRHYETITEVPSKTKMRMSTWFGYSIFESLVSGNEIWMITKIPLFCYLMLHCSLFTELRYFTQVHLWLND